MRVPMPMLATACTLDKARDRYSQYIMQWKFDGVRCQVVKDADNAVTMLTRTHHHMEDKLPHLKMKYSVELPPETIIDGEVGYYSGDIFDFNRTMRVIGSGVDVALQKQEDDKPGVDQIVFVPFDILVFRGNNVMDNPYEKRMDLLETTFGNHISGSPLRFPRFLEDAYVDYVQRGGEGVMLKDPKGVYCPGKRPAHNWLKLKKFETLDVIITGFEPGKGKYEGKVGALIFGLVGPDGKIKEIGQCSGMTDMQRDHMTYLFEHDDRFILKEVIEIRFFGKVGKDGKGLRHPQFLRMRPDKDWTECTL